MKPLGGSADVFQLGHRNKIFKEPQVHSDLHCLNFGGFCLGRQQPSVVMMA
jgi:hypothetical protein